jgi:probable rRNA maturation factor
LSRRAPRYRISVRQTVRPIPFRGEVLRSLVRRALGILEVPRADLRILVVGDEDMERWNREFLGRAGTTNVISFPENDTEQTPRAILEGDILLSARSCLAQTRDWPCSKEERVLYFIIHGVVHLQGYDHEKGRAEAARMRKEEIRAYRSCLGEGRSPI